MSRYVIRVIDVMFKELNAELEQILTTAFHLNQDHDFSYKVFHFGPLAHKFLGVRPKHLFPEAQEYLDSQATPDLLARIEVKHLLISKLTAASLYLYAKENILTIIPGAIVKEAGYRCNHTPPVVSQPDSEILEKAKTEEWYTTLLTHCLFAEMGVT